MSDRDTLARAAKQAAERFADESARKKRAEWRQPFGAGLRFVLLDLITSRAWNDLVRLAADVRHEASHDLQQMTRQQDDWRRVWESFSVLRADFVSNWRSPNTFADWSASQDELLEQLLQKGLDRDHATEMLHDFGRSTARDVMRTIEKPVVAWATDLEECTIGRFSALAAADTSDAVGKFNKYVPHAREDDAATPSVAAELTKDFRDLYDTLKGDDRSGLHARAKSIEAHAEERIDPLLRRAAYLAGPIATSTETNHGREGVDIADSLRLYVLLRSAARVIAWTSGWGEGSAQLSMWREAAREKSFATAFKPPSIRRLSAVASSAAEDQLVSVEGWMGPITISHRGRKVISTGTITDRKGHTLQVGLPYIKLDSGGLVANTYARLVGTYHQHHPDFSGPVLIPTRRSLGHDSELSWMDWLTLKLMPMVTTVAHNLCASWSWSPGTDGAGNPLRYGTWTSTRKGFH